MRFLRPASRALSHLLRHDPIYHSSPASLLSRHSPFAPLSRAFNDPFFSSPFSAPLYTVYEVREDDNSNHNNQAKVEQSSSKQGEVKAAEQQQQQSTDNRLTRHGDNHRQRGLERHSNRRHPHHHHHPLSLFSPFDSLFTSPFFASSSYQPLEISVDLYSTPTAYQVNAAMPGLKKEDIKLTVDDGVLTIEAERREERGRPAKTTPTPPSSTTSSTATASSADATTDAAQSEQKTVEVEVKTDNVDNNNTAAATKTEDAQPLQQTSEDAEDDVAVHHQESYYGRVQRSLQLPDDVNVDGLTAKYEDGVLKIELPRIAEKKQQAKHINIQ